METAPQIDGYKDGLTKRFATRVTWRFKCTIYVSIIKLGKSTKINNFKQRCGFEQLKRLVLSNPHLSSPDGMGKGYNVLGELI